MIAYIEGVIRSVAVDTCVVVTSGIGYCIFYMGCEPKVGDEINWNIYDHIREDRRELFGSPDQMVLDLFQKLIDINGVGPRLAQKILSSAKPKQIYNRISKEDMSFLTSISGVGKKTAQKIILELKGVLVKEDEAQECDNDMIEALISLGYSRREAVDVSRKVEGETMEEKVKSALRMFKR